MPDAKTPQHRYPSELRERAIRMVHETIEQRKERHGAVTRVAKQRGIGTESLRSWVRQAEIDQGQRGGLSSIDQRRIAELERESDGVSTATRAIQVVGYAAPEFPVGVEEVNKRAAPYPRPCVGIRRWEGTPRRADARLATVTDWRPSWAKIRKLHPVHLH